MNKLLVSVSPHIRQGDTTATIMRDVLIALVPALVASVIFFGARALLVAAVTIAVCVLSDRNVGVDAAETDRRVHPGLAGKILSAPERERVDRSDDPRLALLRLWVLKEAAAKLTGEGLRGYPNQTDFSPEDSRVREIDGCLIAVLQEETEGETL